MNNLIEHILNEDYVSAKEIFESRLDEIMARKIYEMKKIVQAEAFGGLTKDEIEQRKKAGYRKASEILGDPRKNKDASPRLNPKAKIIKKKVSEAVEVKPDPEGKIRGGAKSSKGTFKRKAAAVAIKAVRKTARKVGDIGGEIAGRVGVVKDVIHQYKQEKAAATAAETKARRKAAPEASKEPKDNEPPKKPWVQRNINTFRGREPDQDAPPNRGGRLGKVVRAGLKGAESGLHSI